MQASEQPSKQKWISVTDPIEHMAVSFPRQPVHMQFDLPLENTQQLAHLDIYSTPIDKGLYMLSSFSSPFFTGNELESNQFRKILYSFIIKRMFYQPQVFKDHKIVHEEKITWQGHPALRFIFSYPDQDAIKRMSGLAVLKGYKLYTLFYLASEDEFKQDLAQQFVESLHFAD